MRRRVFLLVLPAAAASPAQGLRADDASDSGRARAAVARGDIRPLAGILAAVERRYDGRVIDTELECRQGRWIYAFKLLPPTGRIFMVRIDAATGQFIEAHGPARERP